MDILNLILANPPAIINLVGGITIIAIIWNLFEYTHNMLTQQEKTESVIVLSIALVIILVSAMFLVLNNAR